MKAVVVIALSLAASLAGISSAAARNSDSRARAVVAASKKATGGTAWDKIDGCYEEGTHGDGSVRYKTWFSLRRYGMRLESSRSGTTRVSGFNGSAAWRTGGGAGVDISRDQASVAEALTTFYVSSNAFFFPDRFPAELSFLRRASDHGRSFDVVRITPKRGRALDYWFDRSSHHLSRVVDNSQTPPMVVEANDYRRASGIKVAFSLNVTGPEGRIVDRGRVTSLVCGPTEPAQFDPPAEG